MLKRNELDLIGDPQNAGRSSRNGSFSGASFVIVPPGGTSGGGEGGGGGSDACDLVMTNLSAYQDGELDPDQQRIMDAHLAKCPACAANLETLQTTDTFLQREWQESGPLPSSLELRSSVDAIMGALPPAPVAPQKFAPKRVHARARWIRFSTGFASLLAFMSLLWSSYQLGYVHGRRSLRTSAPTSTGINPNLRSSMTTNLTYAAFLPALAFPNRPPSRITSQTFHR